MKWSGTQVLVTGAGGFIGSHLAEYLVLEGARVRALVHYNALGTRGWLDASPVQGEIQVLQGDVGDAESVIDAVQGVDTVFHLAALIGIPYSYKAPRSYIRTNVEGTVNILSAARAIGVRRVVHTSTSEVYGTAQYVPIDEAHPLQGQSPYSASKIGADKMAEAFHDSFDVPVVTVRPFNTYGPRQSARAVIPTIITQCLVGDKVHLGSLHPTRDLNFVGDTVRGFVLAGSEPDAVGEVINLGTGREISVGQLARLIATIMGRDISISADDTRLRPERSEVERLLADNRRARALLGWVPDVTLEDGLMQTIAWVEANLDRYRPGEYMS